MNFCSEFSPTLSSLEMMLRNPSLKFRRLLSSEPEQSSTMKFRKRLVSEHQDEMHEMKRTKKGNFNFTVGQSDVIPATSNLWAWHFSHRSSAIGLVEHESDDGRETNDQRSLCTPNNACVLLHSSNLVLGDSTTSTITEFGNLVCSSNRDLHDWNNDEKITKQSCFFNTISTIDLLNCIGWTWKFQFTYCRLWNSISFSRTTHQQCSSCKCHWSIITKTFGNTWIETISRWFTTRKI